MEDEIIHIDPGNELDLHHFNPRDVKALLEEFIIIAKSRGYGQIRIIHGKGASVIKSIVRAELSKNVNITSFKDEPGNWGATIACLKMR